MRDNTRMNVSEALQKAASFARSLVEEDKPVERTESAPVAVADVNVAELQHRVATLERISAEYFEVIERIERERDQWKDMFFTQSSEHQNAQAILQKMLADLSGAFRSSMRQLNFFRAAADLDPVASPAHLEALPTDIPEQYGLKIKELTEKVVPQTDGKALREQIIQRYLTEGR